MSIINSILKDELERNLRMQSAYKDELLKYQKGSLTIKKRGEFIYFYLGFRDENNKVKSKYIGAGSKVKIDNIRESLEKRDEISEILKKLHIEEVKLRKIIENDQ